LLLKPRRPAGDAAAAFAASPAQRQAHLAAIRATLAARRRSAWGRRACCGREVVPEGTRPGSWA